MVIGLTTHATRASALTEGLDRQRLSELVLHHNSKTTLKLDEKGANQAIISSLHNARIPTVHGVEFKGAMTTEREELFDCAGAVSGFGAATATAPGRRHQLRGKTRHQGAGDQRNDGDRNNGAHDKSGSFGRIYHRRSACSGICRAPSPYLAAHGERSANTIVKFDRRLASARFTSFGGSRE